MRFERTAFGVGVQRSIQLSYGYVLCGNLSYCTAETGRMSIEIYFFPSLFAGGGGQGRALEDGAGGLPALVLAVDLYVRQFFILL